MGFNNQLTTRSKYDEDNLSLTKFLREGVIVHNTKEQVILSSTTDNSSRNKFWLESISISSGRGGFSWACELQRWK